MWGARIQIVETIGSKLLWAGLVYTAFSMIIVFSAFASGVEPPPIVPEPVINLYRQAWDAYVTFAGTEFALSPVELIKIVAASINMVLSTTLAVLVTMFSSFIYIAWNVSSALPYPLSILSIPIWAAAMFATLILILYMLQKFMEMAGSVRVY